MTFPLILWTFRSVACADAKESNGPNQPYGS